jgi:hypothetical protein
MSVKRLGDDRRLLVCDVCLTYVDADDPDTTAWGRDTTGLAGCDRCPDCAVPPTGAVDRAHLLWV